MSSISPGAASPTPSFTLKNITIDDTDSSLKYSQGWNRSTSSSAHGGSFQVADNVGELVSFSLPDSAVAVYYFGFKQSSGALYESCLDCPSKDADSNDVIDAHSNEPRSTEPMLLYQRTNLDPSVRHTLALLNFADTRFKNSSTITVDSFVVTIKDQDTLSSSTTKTTSTSSESASASMVMSSMEGVSLMAMDSITTSADASTSTPPPDTDGPPPTVVNVDPTPASASVSAASADASGLIHAQPQSNLSAGERFARTMRSPLVLTGVILGSLFVVCTVLYALMYFMRRRKRRMKAPVSTEGHWAARFFGEKGRGSVWLGGHGGFGAKVAKGAMVEQLVPDQPRRPSPPPVSNLQLPPQPRTAPAHSYAFNIAQSPARTVPRSAFPAPPGPQARQLYPGENGQLRRAPSAPGRYARAQTPGAIPPVPQVPPQFAGLDGRLVRVPSAPGVYTRALAPGIMPMQGPGPSQMQVPGQGFYPVPLPGAQARAVMNPYVEEARARVRDRARGFPSDDWHVPEGQPMAYGPVASYERPALPGGSVPGFGFGVPLPGPSVQRNGSFGSQYSQ